MKTTKQSRFSQPLAAVALACACAALPWTAQADNFNWINPGTGDWNNPANWNPGLPFDTGVWDIATINNGGTAVLSTVQPGFEEVQVGDSGAAGNLTITTGGILTNRNWLVIGRTGAGGNTPMSTLILEGNAQLHKTGDGFIVGDGTFCNGQVIVRDNAQVKIAGGWNGIGNGDGGIGYLTLQDNAVYITSDGVSGQDWNVGDWGSGRGIAYIKDNATLDVSRFWVAKGGTTIGAVWQTGGTVNGTGAGATEWCIGGTDSGASEAFGFWHISAGNFSNPFNLHIGRWGKGVFYQTGGTVVLGSWTAVGREANGMGVVYITGGQFSHTNTGPAFMIAEQPSRGEMTLAGTGAVNTAGRLVIGNGGNAILNLNGGTLTVPQLVRWGGSGYLNLDGGAIQAAANEPNFMAGLTEAVVYGGNAIIDTAGFDVTVAQPLLVPTDSGVTSIPIADGGSGYLTPPIVQIDTSGLGAGATAIAQINPVTGVLTNIVMTSSGYGYAAAPGAYLIGGGAANPASLGTATIAPVSAGGLVKNGNGALTLNGVNTFTGPTVVNAGKIVVRTDTATPGALTVADGAGLGVTVALAGSQLSPAGFTLGAATLDFDLGSFGNPSSAPINVTGAFAANGAVIVNVTTALPQLGQFPLIAYGSRTGAGTFVVGSLPSGVVANLVTNGNSIALNVTAVAAPRWNGNVAGGVWDIGTTANWVELSTMLPATYAEGNTVLFNDDATGTTSVALGVAVHPAKVTFNHTNLNYSVSGAGRISGAIGITKQGPGTLALNTQNDYTGVTRIEGGTVSVTNLANGGQPSGIGAASSAANNLVLAGGALSYSGPTATADRGIALQANNSAVEVQTDLSLSGAVTASPGSALVKSGSGRLAFVGAGNRSFSAGASARVENGTLTLDGSSGAQTNQVQEFWVGNTVNQGAAFVLTNSAMTVNSWFSVGRGNGTVGNVSTVTLYDSRLRSGNFSAGWDAGIPGNVATQEVRLFGNSSITNNSDVNAGESFGSTTRIFLNDNSVFFTDWRFHLGWHNGGVGEMTLANSSIVNVDAWFSIGHEGGTGTLTVKDNSRLRVLWDMNITDVSTGTGTMVMQDNARLETGAIFVGKGDNSTGNFSISGNAQVDYDRILVGNGLNAVGTVTQTGGTLIGRPAGNEVHIGFHGPGTWTLSAGSIVAPNHWFIVGRWVDGPGNLEITGGTVTHGANDAGRLFRIGEDGAGVLNLSSTGAVDTRANEVTIGWNPTGNGTLNLNGGSFTARRIIGGAGTSAINFNGGILRAGTNANANFLTALTTATVLAGGAVIDTGNNNVGIAQQLIDGGGNGGLTKQGAGALYLDGANLYVGTTLVSAGTLGGSGSIAGPVSVAAGATLSPGTSIGTLTIANTLGLAASSTTVIEVDKSTSTSDLVAGVTTVTYGGTLVLKNLNGTLAVGDVFNVFDATTFTGTFSSVVSQTPGQTVTWDVSQLAVDGTVRVATAVPNPATLNLVVNGANLDLSWGQLGYRLEVQSNPLTVGLSNNWVTVPGSETVTAISVPISTSTPTAFYRLVFP